MATYSELFELRNNTALRNKVAVAVTKKAQSILDSATPTANQVAWANAALSSPLDMATKLYFYVLAANSAATIGQITSAADAVIQSNVDAAADALIAQAVL